MDDLPYRVVVYAGRTWTVREVETKDQPWAHASQCLICEDGSVVRRFWVYPEDWRELSGEALARFCQTARPIIAAEREQVSGVDRMSDADRVSDAG